MLNTMQNLSKRNPAHLVLRRAIKAPAGYKIVACDSSQVEARVNAWFCREHDLLGHFRSGRDPYAELAERFGYGYTAKEIHDGAKAGDKKLKMLRNAGKVGILSAGYGVGARKYADTLWRDGIRLDPEYDTHCGLAASAHAVYRQSHPNIVYMWKVCQKVIESLAAGGAGWFGGPNDDLMQYGILPIVGRADLAVPTVVSPSGFHLRYPGLRYDCENNEYVYDKFFGRNKIAKRIYGGLLLENCIAEGTLVYTDSGWKPLETVTLADKIYDGLDFVSHSGVICKGVQQCVVVDGVRLTPDHEVLTSDGWYAAAEVDVSRLARPELRGAGRVRVNSPQFQRQDRASVRRVDGGKAVIFHWKDVGLALSVQLRGVPFQNCYRCYAVCSQGELPPMSWLPATSTNCAAYCAWYEQSPFVSRMAEYDRPLSFIHAFCLAAVRWAWNFCLRPVEEVSKFLRRHARQLCTRLGFRQDRQQQGVLPWQLSLGILCRKQQEQGRSVRRRRCGGSRANNGYQPVNDILSYAARLACRAIDYTPLSKQSQVASVQSETPIRKKVYDIRNCGPRHRFVVKGDAGPVIVHNCIQHLAFQILIFQACRMDEAGINLKCNIHDAWATVVPEAEAQATADAMLYHMRRLPDWAKGCPIDAEAEIGTDFTVV